MSYNIKELLVLPVEEKIILADLLYSSVNEELENNSSEWWKNETFISELNEEYEGWKNGKEKGFTLDEVKAFMEEQKTKYRQK